LTREDIPPKTKWVLLLDHYDLDLPFYSEVRGRDFQFLQLAPGSIVGTEGARLESFPRRYNLSAKGGRVISLSGFNGQEDWGVWTRDPTVRVYLDTPVSGNLRIKIRGLAYGPNDGKRIEIKVGAVERQVVFTSAETEVEIAADISVPASFIEFNAIKPVSPALLGHPEDMRLLGVGLSEIQIDRN
jgi:hypothetical protein